MMRDGLDSDCWLKELDLRCERNRSEKVGWCLKQIMVLRFEYLVPKFKVRFHLFY